MFDPELVDLSLAQSPALWGPLAEQWLEEGDWHNEHFADRLEALNSEAGGELVIPSSTPPPPDQPQLLAPLAESASSSPPRSAVLVSERDSPSLPRSAPLAISTPICDSHEYESLAFPASLCGVCVPQPHTIPAPLSGVHQPQPFTIPSALCSADQSLAVEALLRHGYHSQPEAALTDGPISDEGMTLLCPLSHHRLAPQPGLPDDKRAYLEQDM
ncbi:hypothetical protein AURDEDRAFT_171755 [Auricularia subglabra TFB-10046 SS5]|nr:hypothetical protein AURDEDRAFT_171755 [Auricularia subglabra TFB-10046 SS5]